MEQYNYLRHISHYENDHMRRILRSLFDGLKDTERKILYVALKKTGTYNTNQLANQVMSKTEYCHSEQNLLNVILSLVEDNKTKLNMFVDCNNYFKSSLQKHPNRCGILTQLNPFFRALFSNDDTNILTYAIIEGAQYEPQFYVPIIPIVLLDSYDVVSLCCNMLKMIDNESIENNVFTEPKILLNENNKIQQYNSTKEIIEEFYKTRIEMYSKRKLYMTQKLGNTIKEIKNSMRFIGCMMDGHIKIHKKTIDEIKKQLESLSFDLIDGSYEYLLDIPIKNLCYEHWSHLENKLIQNSQLFEYHTRMSPEDIYRDEINKFLTFRNHMESQKIELFK